MQMLSWLPLPVEGLGYYAAAAAAAAAARKKFLEGLADGEVREIFEDCQASRVGFCREFERVMGRLMRHDRRRVRREEERLREREREKRDDGKRRMVGKVKEFGVG